MATVIVTFQRCLQSHIQNPFPDPHTLLTPSFHFCFHKPPSTAQHRLGHRKEPLEQNSAWGFADPEFTVLCNHRSRACDSLLSPLWEATPVPRVQPPDCTWHSRPGSSPVPRRGLAGHGALQRWGLTSDPCCPLHRPFSQFLSHTEHRAS